MVAWNNDWIDDFARRASRARCQGHSVVVPQDENRPKTDSWAVTYSPAALAARTDDLLAHLRQNPHEWLAGAKQAVLLSEKPAPDWVVELERLIDGGELDAACELMREQLPEAAPNALVLGQFRTAVATIRQILSSPPGEPLHLLNYWCTTTIGTVSLAASMAKNWGATLLLLEPSMNDWLECIRILAETIHKGRALLDQTTLVCPAKAVECCGFTATDQFRLCLDIGHAFFERCCSTLDPLSYACYAEAKMRGVAGAFTASPALYAKNLPKVLKAAGEFPEFDTSVVYSGLEAQTIAERHARALADARRRQTPELVGLEWIAEHSGIPRDTLRAKRWRDKLGQPSVSESGKPQLWTKDAALLFIQRHGRAPR